VTARPPAPSASQLRIVWARLDAWLRDRRYAGYDPYDALNATRVPRALLGTPRRKQVLVQLCKRSPIDLRPLLGVAPHTSSKALALVAGAYARLHEIDPDPRRDADALSLLELLASHGSRGAGSFAWGYEFDVQTRWAFYARGTPNIIVTTFVGNAFLDWYEITGDVRLLAVAAAAVAYLNDVLLRPSGGTYYSYVPGSPILVHNANVLGCALACRVARLGGDASLVEVARRAVAPTVAAQDGDGLWAYGRGPGLAWVDGFHTAYVLDGLCEVAASIPEPELHAAVRTGFAAYVSRFFGPRGEPRNTLRSFYPVDIHAASTAIDVLSRRAEAGERGRVTADLVCRWTLASMLDPGGYFYFQRHRFFVNRIAYVRWSQAHMLRALGSLLVARKAGGDDDA
jgi:hypothetical protein